MVLLSDILLFPEVTISFFIESFLLILLSVAFILSLNILKKWKQNATTSLQYRLEKQSYLIITIISFSLIVKIILLPFFTYTLGELSTVVPGAMCAAGVVGANRYGQSLLFLKIVIIMLTLLWMIINKKDLHTKNYPYFKQKIWFFIILFLLITLEYILSFLFLTNISTQSPVLCCSILYKADLNPLPFNLKVLDLVALFYIMTFALMISIALKKRFLIFILSLNHIYISYYAITYFFSTYIYELPTHKCPFCLLQADYYYIGYFIFISLFSGLFYALSSSIFNFNNKHYSYSLFCYFFFICFSSVNFLLYFIKNGVLL
jgi:hypothetical protein